MTVMTDFFLAVCVLASNTTVALWRVADFWGHSWLIIGS